MFTSTNQFFLSWLVWHRIHSDQPILAELSWSGATEPTDARTADVLYGVEEDKALREKEAENVAGTRRCRWNHYAVSNSLGYDEIG